MAEVQMLPHTCGKAITCRGSTAFPGPPGSYALWRHRSCMRPRRGAFANGNAIYSYDDMVGSNVVLHAAASVQQVSEPAQGTTTPQGMLIPCAAAAISNTRRLYGNSLSFPV